MIKSISISLSPNTEKDDVWLALKLKFSCWRWKKGKEIEKLENEFKNYFSAKNAVSFNSGRSAFLAILKSLELDDGDEVLLQAFTCNAASNPIIWAGLKPVYVDVDESTFNIDPEDIKKKINSRTKAVVVQHTFGRPADMDSILKICEKNSLTLIEDCAHSLGAIYNGKKVGTFGRAAFFSFSRDKIISSVYGGMAITNDDDLGKRIKDFQEQISYPSCCWILQQLNHPVLMNWLIIPTYRILGKYLLVLFQRLFILSKAVHLKERKGLRPGYFPKRMPNALAILVLNQFKKLERFNSHRKEIAKFYQEHLGGELIDGDIHLRYTIKTSEAYKVIKKAWEKNLLIGDWYTSPVAPLGTQLDKVYYEMGSCPNAEKLAKETLNLPTHINISKKEAKLFIDFIKANGN